MPSIFGHAIVGATAAHLSPPPKRPKLFWFLTILCTAIPDADVLTFSLGAQYDSFFGHRGFFHSICFAAIFGSLAAGIYLRSSKYYSVKRDYRKELALVIYFFLVTLTHPVLDAMTNGGHGVALFSPIDLHRYFYRYRPIYVSPLSVFAFFSTAGIRIFLNEMLFVFLPCFVILFLRDQFQKRIKPILKGAKTNFTKNNFKDRFLRQETSWPIRKSPLVPLSVFVLLSLFFLIREELISGINGVDVYKIDGSAARQKKNGYSDIPVEDIQKNKLIVNYKDLMDSNLLNTVLVPKRQPWSGSFFPVWYGGVSGRWQDFLGVSLWKSLVNDSLPVKSDLVKLLHLAAMTGDSKSNIEIDRLSPTEKYDIAVGDYHLTSSRIESVSRGRGLMDVFPNTPFWAGYCNAIALAAIYEKEPLQEVRVLNPDGYEVTFYPKDIKALLGISYLYPYPKFWRIGNRCNLDGPKTEACLDVNPATFVLALTNRIGVAKETFVIDKDPFIGVQNEPIRKAEVKVINPPYFASDREKFFSVEDSVVKWLVDVEINLTVSRISPLEPTEPEENLSYHATLGLDIHQNIVGGRWEDPFNHPDTAWGGVLPSTRAETLEDDKLAVNSSIEWSLVKALVEQSSLKVPSNEKIDIYKLIKIPVAHGFSFKFEPQGISGGISYWKLSGPSEVYGRLEGERLDDFKSVDLVDGPDLVVASYDLVRLPGKNRAFFKLKTSQSLEDRENLLLRLNRKKTTDQGLIEFHLPYRKKFESFLKSKGTQ